MKNSIPTVESSKEKAASVVLVMEITDPTAAGEQIEIMDQDVVQLQSQPLRAKRISIRLGDCLVVYQATNLSVRSRTRISEDLFAFVTFGPNAQGTINGVSLRPDLLVVAEPGTAGEFVVRAGYESVSLFVPQSLFRTHLDLRNRTSEFRSPKGIEILQSSFSAARDLFVWGNTLAQTAEQQSELFDRFPASCSEARIELLELLFAAIGSSDEYQPTRKERTRQNHSRIVQIAEDYATSRCGERVSVTDLCAAARVSERTLQYAFHKVMGLAPVTYLTRLRLHRVRDALRKSTRESTTVSNEALAWGFWHFGDFSSAYKKCFGESPSDTLKNDHPSTV